MAWDFHVGQKVVCVDDRHLTYAKPGGWRGLFSRWQRLHHNLNRGDVYTITWVGLLFDTKANEYKHTLRVAGAWHFGAYGFVPFPAFQFRPLVTRKTNISVFKKMLAPVRATEDA